MKKILILDPPPGCAPEEIRGQWVGVELPLMSEEDLATRGIDPDGTYIVEGRHAVNALTAAERVDAARFWALPTPPQYFSFPRDCCEEV